jgi:hypothetical protein
MNDFTPSTQLEDNIRAAIAVPQALPEFVNQLYTDLMHQASLKSRKGLRPFYLRPAWIAFFAVLTLLVVSTLIIGPERVYAAVRQLFGYIPGVGIVEQGSGIRVLAEPVSVEKDGIKVTVEQVVADATHTFVAYRVDGIPPVKSGFPICTDPPALQLPDGSKLSFLGGGAGGMDSTGGTSMTFATDYTFPPLPAGAGKVIFLSPCQMPAIPLALVPAPSNFVTPAVEVDATSISSGPQFPTTSTPLPDETSNSIRYAPSFPATPTPVPHGSGLYLDQVIELEHSYLLVGNFTDAGDLPGVLAVDNGNLPVQITGPGGQPVNYTVRTDIHPAVMWGAVWYWAYEIPRPVHGPLTWTLASIPIHQEASLQIPLDVGQNPQPGQKWVLNKSVTIGGVDFLLDDIVQEQHGYTIHLHSGVNAPEQASLSISVSGVSADQSNGSLTQLAHEIDYSETILFNTAPPTGALTFLLAQYQIVNLPGPWTLTWSPPAP